jgi:hypothetical protein
VVVELASKLGVAAVRVPRAHGRGPQSLGVNLLAQALADRLARADIACPADFAGLDEAGRMDTPQLLRTLRALARRRATTAELDLHPGEEHDPARVRYRWGYRWPDELAALTEPAVRDAVAASGFRLVTHAALVRGAA